MPSNSPTSTALRLPRVTARLSADHLEWLGAGWDRRDGGSRHRRRAAARRLLLPARDAACRRFRRCATRTCRSPSSTDCNPGSSPIMSLLTTMNMACTLFRLTPQEALSGRHAPRRARAGLGRYARQPRSRQDRRFRAVRHRAAGRPRLCGRLESVRGGGQRRRATATAILTTRGEIAPAGAGPRAGSPRRAGPHVRFSDRRGSGASACRTAPARDRSEDR